MFSQLTTAELRTWESASKVLELIRSRLTVKLLGPVHQVRPITGKYDCLWKWLKSFLWKEEKGLSRAGHLLLDHSHCLCEWRGSQPKRTIILQWDVRQCPNELAKGTRLDGVICYQEARCSDRTTSIFHACHCLGSFSFSLHDNQIIVCTPYWAGRLLDRLTAHPGQEQCQEPLDTVQKWAKSPGWLLSRSCLWRSRKPFLFTSSVKDVWNCTTSLH